MRFKAHTYQERAIRWVESTPRCMLFLDMGLGKSVITLTAVQNLIDHAEVERVLVVAPKKVAESTWSTEAEKWDHLDLRVSRIIGDVKKRRAGLNADADIYVVGRDSLVWLINEEGAKGKFDMLVLDELSSFKNHRSQRFKAARLLSLTTHRVVGLTGTPTPNGLVDLWAQTAVVDLGERLGKSFRNFAMEHFRVIERNHIPIKYDPKPGAVNAIGRKIEDISLTMKAEDWLDLPELIEHDVEVELGEKAMKGYREFEKARVMEIMESGGEVTAMSAAALTNKLSQYANGAVYVDGFGGLWVEMHKAKIEMLEEIMESVDGNVLCFYQYKHDCDRIKTYLKDYEPREYKGSEDLDDWNAGKIRLLLAHPASTAFGLNMQHGGHTVVWFSTGWNLELYQQANARLHRQGQRFAVMVHRLVAKGTVDERMKGAIDGKGMSQEEFLKLMIASYRK
ncbi:MAG: DEAD/DEAH box helicase family protein [Muribaculaceae bacterium]|nr:DEAD/DEAH box helicase family protein [Muribaculaceae bacterium]